MSPADNQSCLVGAEDTVSLLVCAYHTLEDWAGLSHLEDYLSYLEYLLWVFTPLAIVFILPFLIVIFLYLSILFLYVYKRKNQLREAYSNNLWDGARKTLATLWDGHGAIWHGYEIHGMEKIPDTGPALIVYYHGAIPIDYYYFLANVIIQKGRTCHSVGDHFLFKIPGFKLLLEVFSVIHGPQEECVRALRNGHMLGISPGGVREALFSDETYPLLWGKRRGFAQVAIDSQVPVIPMFTQNVREGFRSLGTLSAAGSPVFDRPAPADPRKHHESPAGKIPHQKKKAITAALQWRRENVPPVSKKTNHMTLVDRQNVAAYFGIVADLPLTSTAAAESSQTHLRDVIFCTSLRRNSDLRWPFRLKNHPFIEVILYREHSL
ncbi:unnamed protein product [Tetraodon nigroviridis]|uniref:(spotted green pufferfish) hypothetical protein n=1 Tax=Tetraodon nigroviridis TaxID=99883 RepID=Q4RJ03_TETNG|nr:unnamed protein product [Tetraodon nigroviridis]